MSASLHFAKISLHFPKMQGETGWMVNLNAYAERWVRSVKEECLSKIVLFGERSLRVFASGSSLEKTGNGVLHGGANIPTFSGGSAERGSMGSTSPNL